MRAHMIKTFLVPFDYYITMREVLGGGGGERSVNKERKSMRSLLPC